MESPVMLVRTRSVPLLLLLPLLLSGKAGAQEPSAGQEFLAESEIFLPGDDPVPGNLAALEAARTRMCVPALALLDELDSQLQPLAVRSARIRALAQAVTLEDSVPVSPLDGGDPLEAAVREWFVADAALALRYVETRDEAIQEERSQGKAAIRARMEEDFTAVSEAAQGVLASAEELDPSAMQCEGAVLVRSVVLEVCATTSSPVCAQARNEEEGSPFRFVDAAEDLWDMEQLRPWTDPSPIFPTPDGQLAGASTATLTRRGNLVLSVALEPMIQPRTAIAPEDASRYDENLQALGFTFDHPAFVMAPVLLVELDIPGRLGEESHYLLHFGDLSDPPSQVIWTFEADGEGPIQAILPLGGGVLSRLASGEELSLTAVYLPEDETEEGSAIFTLSTTSVGQARAVTTLVSYLSEGGLSRDLAQILPPDEDPSGG